MGEQFSGPHTSPWHERIATGHEILRTQVGSGLHGVTIAGTDDRDEMGICIEPPECVIGLKQFEQYIFRTQPEGHRSGAGDLDLIVYSLRKFATLAAAGNPTILMPLFAPESEIVVINAAGEDLRGMRELFLSQQAGERFLGYLRSQRNKMVGGSGHTNRPELIEKYGFDAKHAYHALRLAIQGAELMSTGSITLPMTAEHREFLLAVRTGGYTKDEVIARLDDFEHALVRATEDSRLPERPDHDAIDAWLVRTHREWWEAKEL
jgi:predicted nucleotidyltransferase